VNFLKNLDVLIVSTAFGENTAAYRRLSYFARYLRSKGLRVSCIGFIGISSFGIIKPSRECYSVPFFISTYHILGLILNAFLSLLVATMILILRPKIVILSVPEVHPVIATYLGCVLTKSKLIIDIRDPEEVIIIHKYRQGFSGLIARIFKEVHYSIYRRASAITGVTRTLVSTLANMIRRTVHLVPNGADLEIFKPIDKVKARGILGLDQDYFLIVYIGSLTTRGYYDVLPVLKAIRKVRERTKINTKLVVAGPIFYDSEKIVEEFRDVLCYMGILDVKDIITLLSACDVGIVPRIKDPIYNYSIPIKFYEYVATGLPVIAVANKESELAKIVEENKLGFICEPEDKVCLENTIIALATDNSLLNELKKNVLAFRRLIDRRIGAEGLYRLIKELLQE